jgi:S-adenosylmethionine decarboxylase
LTVTPLGTHCILELHGCPSDLLNDVVFVRDALARASEQGLSTLLHLTSHQFDPQGVTAVGLLAESHVSIHTWPEHGYAAVDIFTCGGNARPRQACAYLVKRFGAREHILKILSRGAGIVECASASADQPLEEEAVPCRVLN